MKGHFVVGAIEAASSTKGHDFLLHEWWFYTTVWLQFGVVKGPFSLFEGHPQTQDIISYYHIPTLLSASNESHWEDELPILISPAIWLDLIQLLCSVCKRDTEKNAPLKPVTSQGTTNNDLHFQGMYCNNVHLIKPHNCSVKRFNKHFSGLHCRAAVWTEERRC